MIRRIPIIVLFCISLASCLNTDQSTPEIAITGNWFFIDKELDSMFFYNEVYIDSTNLHYSLGNTGLIPSFEYRIINDTIFLTSQSDIIRPFIIIKGIKPDTLTMEMIPYQIERSNKILTYVRLNSGEKGVLDYDKKMWQNSDSLYNQYASDNWRRFEEYLIAIGETTREQLDLEKADSSNYIIIPEPEYLEKD